MIYNETSSSTATLMPTSPTRTVRVTTGRLPTVNSPVTISRAEGSLRRSRTLCPARRLVLTPAVLNNVVYCGLLAHISVSIPRLIQALEVVIGNLMMRTLKYCQVNAVVYTYSIRSSSSTSIKSCRLIQYPLSYSIESKSHVK